MITHYFKKFFNSSQSSGVMLLIAVVVALFLANSSAAMGFNEILHRDFGTDFLHLKYPLHVWVNDGLMAIFFLLVGLEIKRELLDGELSSIKSASLPIIAALGGMIVPALIYVIFNHQTQFAKGWGIPMATDIAFSLAIVSMLGRKVPASLKIFLAALAIADDLGAILVIAFFYTDSIQWIYLGLAAGVFGVMMVFNYLKINRLYFYLIPGLALWYFLHHSGIHATIAGVLTAIAIPATDEKSETSPLEILEEKLHLPVNYLIMPIFALANTNITFHTGMVDHLFSNFSLGILAGLSLGKMVGICLFSYLAVRFGIGTLPEKSSWKQMAGLGFLAGIGFTMSIFIAMICFKTNPGVQDEAKFAVLTASALSGVLGYLILKISAKNEDFEED